MEIGIEECANPIKKTDKRETTEEEKLLNIENISVTYPWYGYVK